MDNYWLMLLVMLVLAGVGNLAIVVVVVVVEAAYGLLWSGLLLVTAVLIDLVLIIGLFLLDGYIV